MTDIVQKTVGANALYVIDESNNTLVVDQTNGRVGINNTNPGYNLTITGATHTSANLSAGTDLFLVDEGNSRVSVGTTTGVSGFTFNVSGNTTLIGDMLVGTELKWDNTNDRLGIGTTAPSSSLHIVGVDDDNPELIIQRSGVTTQYLSLMNEDASGGIIAMHSGESNKKTLALESVHNSGGSAAGDNLIIFRTGAASGPTERVRISDTNGLFTIQSGTALLVDDTISVGAAAPVLTNSSGPYSPSISVSKSSTTVSGGLFSSSVGESAITNNQAGWWLTAGGMNTSSKYTPALKFGSTDPAFTTDNPKYLAGITGRSTQTYSADTDGGMAMDFLTFPSSGGVDGIPTTRMTIDQNGRVGIGANMGSPSAAFHVRTQNDASTFVALFESEDDGASAAPDIGLLRDSTSPAASDDLGHVRWRGNHSGGSQLDYADMFAEIGSPTDGSEAGYLNLRVAHANNAGGITDFIRLRGDLAGAVVINDSGRADVDFRVETDTNSSALFIDASTNTAEINVPLNLGSTLTHYNNTAPAAGQLLIGDASAGVWDAATLTAGSNITITNADGAITIAASGGGGGGSPGGANGEVQYNNGGAFGADADFVYDTSTRSVAVGFTAAGQSSGSISSDVMTASNNIAVRYNQAGAPAGTYGLTLSDANMSWPGAAVGSSPTIMPAIDLSAGNYDFATLNGAGNCAQTHYLMITVGGNGPEAILMPDPAAVGIPPGSRWTICHLDNGGLGNIEFGGQTTPPCPPLAGVYTNVTFAGIGSITLFTDGTSWFVESDTAVQNRGRITIEYL